MGAFARLLSFLPGSYAVAAVVLFGAAVTWEVGQWQRGQEIREARAEFDRSAKEASTEFLHRLNMAAELVHGLATVQQLGGRFDLEKWNEYAGAIDAQKHHPGLQAYGIALRVGRDEAGFYRTRLAFEGFERPRAPWRGASTSPEPAGIYWPITYAAPREWLREKQGFDLTALPYGEPIFDTLCNERKAVMTAPLPLDRFGRRGETGFLVLHPVFDDGKAPGDARQCGQRIQAIVFALFSSNSFLGAGSALLSRHSALRAFDVGDMPSSRKVLFGDAATDRTPPLLHHEMLSFGGRTWNLEFSAPEAFEDLADRSRSNLSMLVSAALTLMTIALVWLMSAARAAAQREASSAGEELRAQRERFASAMEATSDGIWERDLATNSFYVSPRFEALLGYAQGTFPVLSFDPYDLVHPDDLPRLKAALGAHLKGAPPFSVDVRICNYDGHFFWVRVQGHALRGKGARAVKILGSVADISQERKERERLRRSDAELRRHRDRLQEMVSEQTKHLILAKERAEEALATRSSFLANMSHELRTPMHASLSFAHLGLSRAEKSSPEKMKDFFSRIALSGNRLLELVNNLLDLSKLEAGKMPIELRPNDLSKTFSEVVRDLEALAASRQVAIRVEAPAVDMRAEFDHLRMVQVMHNLLSNALKFTPSGRLIDVRYIAGELPRTNRADGSERMVPAVGFVVSDQGIGIPEGEAEVIFEKFVQSSKTHTGAGGTGLGLAICREIIELHGGRIVARNNSGGGAEFEVLIPASSDGEGRDS